MRASRSAMLCWFVAGLASAQDMYFGRTSEQGAQILPGDLLAGRFAGGIPMLGYDPNWEWSALVCDGGCSLVPVRLKMTPRKVQPYDGEPIAGQTLTLDRKLDAPPLVLLHGVPAKLSEHPLTWLHGRMKSYPAAATPGTMDLEIPVAGGAPARIVPRMKNTPDGVVFDVHLEMDAKSQLLGTMPLDAVTGPATLARGTRLLLWAGDLDADGKLDLVFNFASRDGEETAATLFLSSAASDGELLHAVASFDYFPVESAGC